MPGKVPEKTVHYNANTSKMCLICGEGDANTHVLHELSDGVYYGGISFHRDCLDMNMAIALARQEVLGE